MMTQGKNGVAARTLVVGRWDVRAAYRRGSGPRRVSALSRRIENGNHRRHHVRRKPGDPCVLAHHLLVFCEIDAVDLVAGDVGVFPLDALAEPAQGLVADAGEGTEPCRIIEPHAGDVAFDHETAECHFISIGAPAQDTFGFMYENTPVGLSRLVLLCCSLFVGWLLWLGVLVLLL